MLVYGIFLYFHIAIFGWNLGLIFAPLTAGYVETILADKIIGEDIGAISAFILFAYTTFYSFILKNPTLGLNLITIGSVAVILQAAFPTLINYILLVVVIGSLSYILGIFKKITNRISNKMGIKEEAPIETHMGFNETESNAKINSLGFIYLTSTDILNANYENLGLFSSNAVLDIDKRLLHIEHDKIEKERLNRLKQGKDECIIKLAKKILSNGGNGVVDLEIHYGLIGLGGDMVQINATGIGVDIKTYKEK